MPRGALVSLFALVVVAALAVPASAHVELTNPPARYPLEHQKNYPCGQAGNPAGTNPPTVLQAGEQITVSFDEFVDHNGHFRISISAEGDNAFVDPSDYMDFYAADNVVLDAIADDQAGGVHEVELTVPDMPCDPCSLQLMQVMYSGAPFSGAALYYQCADIVIEGVAATSDSGESTEGNASASAGDTSSADAGDAGSTSSAVDDAGDETPADTGASGATDTGLASTNTGASTTATEDDEGGGCGCRSSARPNALWALAPLVVAWTRRRRSSASRPCSREQERVLGPRLTRD